MRTLYHAVDDLIEKKNLSDEAWQALSHHLSKDQCVEFCMLIGHYIMVAITINTLGIQIEPEFRLE